MIALASFPATTTVIESRPAPTPVPGAAARALAAGYLRYVSALWRGDPEARAFEPWLAAFWCPDLASMPPRPPDAISPHAAGGRGICWHETAEAVVGHVPGVDGGYRVPLAAIATGSPAWAGGRGRRRSVPVAEGVAA